MDGSASGGHSRSESGLDRASVSTRKAARSPSPLWNGLVVLDQGEWVIEMVEKGAPFLVSSGFSEADRVVIRLPPLNEQQVVGASSRSA